MSHKLEFICIVRFQAPLENARGAVKIYDFD